MSTFSVTCPAACFAINNARSRADVVMSCGVLLAAVGSTAIFGVFWLSLSWRFSSDCPGVVGSVSSAGGGDCVGWGGGCVTARSVEFLLNASARGPLPMIEPSRAIWMHSCCCCSTVAVGYWLQISIFASVFPERGATSWALSSGKFCSWLYQLVRVYWFWANNVAHAQLLAVRSIALFIVGGWISVPWYFLIYTLLHWYLITVTLHFHYSICLTVTTMIGLISNQLRWPSGKLAARVRELLPVWRLFPLWRVEACCAWRGEGRTVRTSLAARRRITALL